MESQKEFEDIKSKIRKIPQEDFSLQMWTAIASAHIEALPRTINSIAGEMHLKRLYKVTNEYAFGETVALTVEDDLAAVLTVSCSSNKFPFRLIFQSASGLITSFPKIPFKEYLGLVVDLIQVNNYYRTQPLNSIKVLTLFVVPKYRQKGLARIILQHSLSTNLCSNAIFVLVDVFKESTATIETYSKLGFKKCYESSKSIIMKKSLVSANKYIELPGSSL